MINFILCLLGKRKILRDPLVYRLFLITMVNTSWLKTIGCSKNPKEVKRLFELGKKIKLQKLDNRVKNIGGYTFKTFQNQYPILKKENTTKPYHTTYKLLRSRKAKAQPLREVRGLIACGIWERLILQIINDDIACGIWETLILINEKWTKKCHTWTKLCHTTHKLLK